MSHSALAAGLRYLRGKLAAQEHQDDSDEQLLHAFAARRDDNAFTVLVRRHGPMVLQVCRGVLGHQQDAEDAFQATFLVLAQNAGTLRKKSSLSSFLHGIAHRLALSAKRAAARRHKHEGCLGTLTQPRSPINPADEMLWREVRTLLDEEIARLPDALRSVFILCCLEELSQAEAGRRLGLKERTVSNRLAEARKRLGQRLAQRGVELSVVLAATTLSALPDGLAASTTKAALATAAGEKFAGVVSASVVELMEAGGAGIVVSKMKAATVLLLAASVLGGAGLWFAEAHMEKEQDERGRVSAPREALGALTRPRSPEASPTLVLRGRVLGPDNKPVAGAKLYLPRWSKDRQKEQGDVAVVQRGITDKEGRFHLELSRNDIQPDKDVPVVAAADGFGLAWIEAPQKDSPAELTLRLVKDVPIRGRLLTTEGKPVVGVTVTVGGLVAFERLDDFLRVFQRETKHSDEGTGAQRLKIPLINDMVKVKPTDKDGRFEIRGVGIERLVGIEAKSAVIAHTMILVVTRANFDSKAYLTGAVRRNGDRVPPLFGPSFEHVVERSVAAAKGPAIEGAVHEAGSGKAVAGAIIQARGASTVTDAQGHYRLAGMQMQKELGQYVVNVIAPKDQPLLGRGVKVAPTADGKPMRVDVELPRGVVVIGRLYDKATGKGVRGWIYFTPLPENKMGKTDGLGLGHDSGDDGRFRLVTIPGPGVLLAQARASFKIDGVSIDTYKLAEFDAADRPRIKMDTRFKPHRFFVSVGGSTSLDIFNACKVLDVKDDGTAVTCDLALDPGKTQMVELRDPDGKPLTGAVVAGVGAETLRAVPFKTATGRIYALDPDNPRPVVFLHVQRKLAAVVPLRGDEKGPVTVRLAPAGVITGRVLDGDGQPIAGAEVYTLYERVGRELTKSQTRWFLPRTDKEGRFRLEGIVPGINVQVRFLKGRQVLVPQTPLEIKPLQSGQTLDVGDIRTKPRRS